MSIVVTEEDSTVVVSDTDVVGSTTTVSEDSTVVVSSDGDSIVIVSNVGVRGPVGPQPPLGTYLPLTGGTVDAGQMDFTVADTSISMTGNDGFGGTSEFSATPGGFVLSAYDTPGSTTGRFGASTGSAFLTFYDGPDQMYIGADGTGITMLTPGGVATLNGSEILTVAGNTMNVDAVTTMSATSGKHATLSADQAIFYSWDEYDVGSYQSGGVTLLSGTDQMSVQAALIQISDTDGAVNLTKNAVNELLLNGSSVLTAASTGVFDPDGAATSAISAHVAAVDPHGDRADAASKYFPLTGGTVTADSYSLSVTNMSGNFIWNDGLGLQNGFSVDPTSAGVYANDNTGQVNASVQVASVGATLTANDVVSNANSGMGVFVSGAGMSHYDGTNIFSINIDDTGIVLTSPGVATLNGSDILTATHIAASDPHGDRAYALGLVDDLSGVSNASTARTNLGLGTAAVRADTYFALAAAGAPTGGSIGQVLTKNSGTNYDYSWITPSGGGSGDVVGPASAVDGNVALFDTATGKLLKDGGTLGSAAFVNTTNIVFNNQSNTYTGDYSQVFTGTTNTSASLAVNGSTKTTVLNASSLGLLNAALTHGASVVADTSVDGVLLATDATMVSGTGTIRVRNPVNALDAVNKQTLDAVSGVTKGFVIAMSVALG